MVCLILNLTDSTARKLHFSLLSYIVSNAHITGFVLLLIVKNIRHNLSGLEKFRQSTLEFALNSLFLLLVQFLFLTMNKRFVNVV